MTEPITFEAKLRELSLGLVWEGKKQGFSDEDEVGLDLSSPGLPMEVVDLQAGEREWKRFADPHELHKRLREMTRGGKRLRVTVAPVE